MKPLEVYAIVVASDGKLYPAYDSRDLAGVKRAIEVGQCISVNAVIYNEGDTLLFRRPEEWKSCRGTWRVLADQAEE